MITKNKNKKSLMNLLRKMSIVPVAIVALYLFACTNQILTQTEQEKPANNTKSDDEPFLIVEEMPVFPGGDEELIKYVSENLKYPKTAFENNIQGRVFVQFAVTSTGTIGEIKILRGVDPELDAEAVRVIKSLPAFTPGRQGGVAVPVWYQMPITFRTQVEQMSTVSEKPADDIRRFFIDDEAIRALIGNDTIKAVLGNDTIRVVIDGIRRAVIDGTKRDDEPFVIVEEPPMFPGGEEELFKFVQENLVYPESAKNSNIQGRVFVQFAVTSTGAIGEIRILRGVDPELDAEAVRVIKSLPAFTPGRQGGVAVSVWYQMPITFQFRSQ